MLTKKNNEQFYYKPKISVIIPIYNTEQYLKDCLDSIMNQTLKDIEIICIDDKSTDDSLKLLKKYKEEYDKNNRMIIIENSTNQGQGIARNKGLKIANGEYIAFIDADDFIDSDYFETLYNKGKECNTELVVFKNTYHFYTKNNEKKLVKLYNSENFYKFNDKDITEYAWDGIVWKNKKKNEYILNKQLKFPNEKLYYEDHFFIQILRYYLFIENKPIYIIDDTKYYYRRDNCNSTVVSKIQKTNDIIVIANRIYEFYKKNNLLDKYPFYKINRLISELGNQIYVQDFYEKLRNFFIKIKKDNLINFALYNSQDIWCIKSVLLCNDYQKFVEKKLFEKQNFYINKQIATTKTYEIVKIKLFKFLPIFKIKSKNNKIQIYLFNFLPILSIKTR